MCIYSKSKITTYALRSSVFCFQNRLITEPVQDKGGQFAADLCIVFIYFVFQHQLLKEAGESWQALVEFAFVYKLLSLKYNKSKTVSVLMSISVPNNTRFCVNFTFSVVSHFSFNIVSSEVRKRLIQAHFQNVCSMLSFSSLQKPYYVTMLHLYFHFLTFMKTVFQEIFGFSFSLHFKQQFGIQLSFTRILY